jgi:hypothetical protein
VDGFAKKKADAVVTVSAGRYGLRALLRYRSRVTPPTRPARFRQQHFRMSDIQRIEQRV